MRRAPGPRRGPMRAVSRRASLDLLQRARARPDVARGRADENTEPLLLEDVRRPAGRPRAREHRRSQLWRHLGDVEDDSRPVLDVRPRVTLVLPGDRLVRDLLQLLGHVDPRRAELLRDALENARTGILCTVDA